jgi:hypothetical protein
MTAEVHEGARGEADQYAVVAEDIEAREADEETGRSKRCRATSRAEGTEPADG